MAGGVGIQLLEQLRGVLAFFRAPANAEMVSAVGNLYAQVFLDLLQVLVVAATEHGKPAVIGG